uniref:melanoma antigen preferentially expressed in tumors-like n=1 Tax=Jaculus jaculus TaxID=51337 RepID=UPI0003330162|nr:melanoma antigen preferentially expressed in tumors-like [Jaculus jaculus]
MTMDRKDPATLLELAIQSLLNNEPAAIHALREIPRELFPPLFTAAFKGGCKKTLAAMVKTWPFFCLHIGKLGVQEAHDECLKAMIDGLQVLPEQNTATGGSKLKILDLRPQSDCRTTCSHIITKSPVCFHSCPYFQNFPLKREAQHSTANLGSQSQLPRNPTELVVDISLDNTLRATEFLCLLLNKVEQSIGCLHLCCRDLQIYKLSKYKNKVKFLNMLCIDHLKVDQASLSEANKLLSQMVLLDSLTLSKITFRSLNGKVFRTFLSHLERMDNLQELHLSYFCIRDHLHEVLRVLPNDLDFLNLRFCELSYRDFTFLSQSHQATHLKLLNLSNNPVSWEDSGPLRILLENLSGTLQHLELNHCLIADSTVSALIPALSRCSHLRVFSFASNPITMSMLMRIVQHLTLLMELKYVFYPIPVHCYEQWHPHGNLDQQKLAEVKAQLKMMLHRVQRNDMNWNTFSE